MLCDYGCGKKAKYQFKNGKWCCSKHRSQCLYIKEQLSKIWKNNIDLFHWSKQKNKNITIKKIKKNHINVSKKNNPNWKGGYFSKNIPTYNFFKNKLTIEEDPRRDINDRNILTVVCSYCKIRFIPNLHNVQERVRSLNGKQYGEQRLYCSEECKDNCSIFYKSIYQNNHPKKEIKNYTQEEYQQFREHVLERDEYKCQFCGNTAEHVHHERPQKLEPFYSLDPDYAWSVCNKCHYKYGHKDDCSTGQLANKVC